MSGCHLPPARKGEGGTLHTMDTAPLMGILLRTAQCPTPWTLPLPPTEMVAERQRVEGAAKLASLRPRKTPHRDHLTESRHSCTALPSQKDTAPCGPMLPGHPSFFEPLLSFLTSFIQKRHLPCAWPTIPSSRTDRQ